VRDLFHGAKSGKKCGQKSNIVVKDVGKKAKKRSMKVIEKYSLNQEDINRIIEMAWEDRTPFDAITTQFGLTESEVIELMKFEMKLSNWKKWRARVQGRATKHLVKLRQIMGETGDDVHRHKSRMQRPTGNRISKKKY
jgi:uncharacterized protein (TIGR03643 family)